LLWVYSASEWYGRVGIVSVDAAEGGFQKHCIPGRFSEGALVFCIVDGSMEQAGCKINLIFILEDPLGVLQDCTLAGGLAGQRYDCSVQLDRVCIALMHFWPEPAHAGLFGLAVHMVADHPVYPEPTQLLCCHRVCLVDIDLNYVPDGLCCLSFGLVCKETQQFTAALVDGWV
jgi:hypothetical protein